MGQSNVASGSTSTALGAINTASGSASTTIGVANIASGSQSLATGFSTKASGSNAVSFGASTIASGDMSFASGINTIASGNNSTAMGTDVSTNGFSGSFAIGDYNTTLTNNTAANQMMMRFAGGYTLYSNSDLSAGSVLSPGSNSWSTISDRNKKENFALVNGEDFLKKIAGFNLTSWNYKGQDAKIFRHYGPMAQDFFAAFGKDKYGVVGNDTTINQADFQGVSFIAIQALEKRTDNLSTENKQLKNENEKLKQEIEDIQSRLMSMEKLLIDQKKTKDISGK